MSWSDDKELSSQANIIYRLKFSIKKKKKTHFYFLYFQSQKTVLLEIFFNSFYKQ